jgi:hypothetical protein
MDFLELRAECYRHAQFTYGPKNVVGSPSRGPWLERAKWPDAQLAWLFVRIKVRGPDSPKTYTTLPLH